MFFILYVYQPTDIWMLIYDFVIKSILAYFFQARKFSCFFV